MNTHDRTPTNIREYMAERDPKSAAEIQRDINLMRLAYEYRMNSNQRRRDEMIGWSLIAVMVCIFILSITLIIFG